MDWKAIIAELDKLGMKQTDIAAACKCRQSTISELARGVTRDPRHSIGEALRQLLSTKRREAAEKAVPGPAPAHGAAPGAGAAAVGV